MTRPHPIGPTPASLLVIPAFAGMTTIRFAVELFIVAALTSIPLVVAAQEAFAGSWKIEKSEAAPWARTADMIEAKEVKRLVGATVEFKSDRVVGPQPLACKGPHYEIKQYQADEVFQGALAEYGDPSTTPDKMAAKIGFSKRPIASLVTGCAAEIEFHAIDTDHLVFALNNSIYRLSRAQPAAEKTKP